MKKFLICEDDHDLIEFLNIYLKLKNYDFMIVDQGLQVAPAIKQNNIGFLFLDLGLPDISGEEVVEIIRKDPEISDLPIYIVSASVHAKKIADSLDVNGLIAKPFELDELEKVIEQNLYSPDN